MENSFKKLTAYNLWANKRIINCITDLPSDLLNTELKSSFKTVNLTILHMWDAETIWLERLNGNSPKIWPSANINNETSPGELLIISSKDIYEKLSSQSDSYSASIVEYNDMKGIRHNSQVSDIIHHLVNHSTFHRGQIVTMLRELGVTQIPSTDYITFTREASE